MRISNSTISLTAKPIRPGHHPNIGASTISINSSSPVGQDLLNSSPSIIRAVSPSRIPIVPVGAPDHVAPVIKGGQRSEGDAIIGGSGVSQRIRNAIGPDTFARSRGHRGG